MKHLLIYERPVALDRVRHRGIRIPSVLDGFGFARNVNSVPLVTGEFAPASRDFPIVFAGADQAVMPAALLGLRGDDNLFVDQQGQWIAQAYVPAFFRRYPFVVAGTPESALDFNVWIDEAFLGADASGEPLFQADGQDAPVLTQAIGFLTEYQNEVIRTRAFVELLTELKLLVPKTLTVARNDSPSHTMQGFSVVDEQRMNSLSAKGLKKLHQMGALPLVYAHLLSLTNVQRLSARHDQRLAGLH